MASIATTRAGQARRYFGAQHRRSGAPGFGLGGEEAQRAEQGCHAAQMGFRARATQKCDRSPPRRPARRAAEIPARRRAKNRRPLQRQGTPAPAGTRRPGRVPAWRKELSAARWRKAKGGEVFGLPAQRRWLAEAVDRRSLRASATAQGSAAPVQKQGRFRPSRSGQTAAARWRLSQRRRCRPCFGLVQPWALPLAPSTSYAT